MMSAERVGHSVPSSPAPFPETFCLMKAFLLAAGHGTRLRPVTDRVPKCLVPIGGVPMLRIWLDLCAAHGVTDVLINVHSYADTIRDFLARDNGNGVSVRISEEPVLLGSAGTLAANRDWVAGESSFWVLYADVLTNADLSQMLAFHRARGQLATLGLYRVPDPARCGIVKLDSAGIIYEFVEKPKVPASNLAFTGLMLATPAVIDLVPPQEQVDIGSHLLPRLVGRMAGYTIDSYIMDIGTLENYQAAQRSWPDLRQPHD
jgi:mannose-1-phosphate guanylyltransferase